MLSVWRGMRHENDLDLRMQFTTGILFYAQVFARSSQGAKPAAQQRELDHHALVLIERIRRLSPAAARRLDGKLVAIAIKKKSAQRRWDWKSVVAAWGRTNLRTETWRIEWNSNTKALSPGPANRSGSVRIGQETRPVSGRR